jgi:hypothetical protein
MRQDHEARAVDVMHAQPIPGGTTMEDTRDVAIGDAIVYTDPHGVDHAAICTNAFGPTCINVAFVSGDPSRTDTFGRQLERQTSVAHQRAWPAHGNFWRHVGETKKETAEPSAARQAAVAAGA